MLLDPVINDKGDGVLSGAELKGLALWNDADGDGVSEPGEVIPVEVLGITSLSCTRRRMRWAITGIRRGAAFKDGTTRPTYDWIAPYRAGE